jgi:hypothetical protein
MSKKPKNKTNNNFFNPTILFDESKIVTQEMIDKAKKEYLTGGGKIIILPKGPDFPHFINFENLLFEKEEE